MLYLSAKHMPVVVLRTYVYLPKCGTDTSAAAAEGEAHHARCVTGKHLFDRYFVFSIIKFIAI